MGGFAARFSHRQVVGRGGPGEGEHPAGGPPVHHTGKGLRVVNLQLRSSLPPLLLTPHFDCFDLLALMMSA